MPEVVWTIILAGVGIGLLGIVVALSRRFHLLDDRPYGGEIPGPAELPADSVPIIIDHDEVD